MARRSFIKLDDSQLRELDSLFSGVLPKEITRAKRIALSRTRRGTKARISTWLRSRAKKNYAVKAKRIKQGLFLSPIRKNESFVVQGTSKPISLTSFGTARWTKRGVKVTVVKGSRITLPRAFIRPGVGGADQVFSRFGRKGEPLPIRKQRAGFHAGKVRRSIRALKGPSIAGMMRATDAETDLVDFLQDRFDTEAVRAINFAVRRRR